MGMQSNLLQNSIHKFVSKITHRSSELDQSAQEDLSYEDALLDVEIRSFMRAEYGKENPPDGVFARVMQAVKLYREEQAGGSLRTARSGLERVIRPIGQALAAAYRYGARPDSGRIISGSLITALLVLAVWPGLARSLANSGQLPMSIDVLLSGQNAAPAGSSTGTLASESATSTSAAPEISTPLPAAPSGSSASTAPQANFISPGRLYEDPRLLIAQRTGEDPNQLKRHFNKQMTGGEDGPNYSDTDPGYNRPMAGQY